MGRKPDQGDIDNIFWQIATPEWDDLRRRFYYEAYDKCPPTASEDDPWNWRILANTIGHARAIELYAASEGSLGTAIALAQDMVGLQ